eukprot:3467785-Lingulodinium_polyedra.AAC.1
MYRVVGRQWPLALDSSLKFCTGKGLQQHLVAKDDVRRTCPIQDLHKQAGFLETRPPTLVLS